MKVKNGLLSMVVAAGMFAALVPAANAEDRVSPAEAAALSAETQLAVAEGVVANDRTGTIGSIINKWSGAMGNAAALDQFNTTLKAASNMQLAKIFVATSMDQVRAILLGDKLAATANGGIVIENLGDLTQDLVFTPNNPPCRIFDTRNQPGGVAPAGGTVKSYQVYGSAATITAQGGNTAGCTAPKGEPVAVSANFTAVPVGVQGHIRVYPYGGSLPTVSFVNFNGVVGNNIANSGIISTCYLCAYDLNVYNGSQTHHIGDVMGFFYPVSTTDPSFNEVKAASTSSGFSSITSDGVIHMVTSPYVTHTTESGDRVHISAMQALGTSAAAGASGLDLWPCYRVNSPQGTPITIGGGSFGMQTTVNTRVPMSISGVATPGAGTFDFGLCYRTSNTNWNNNEWGYVSTIVLNF